MTNELQNSKYEYVFVGGGMASGYAVLGIREHDKNGSILIITEEAHVPYERPALSKKIWRADDYKEEQTKIGAEEQRNVDFIFEQKVDDISPNEKNLRLENGATIHYNKLLLATGSEPISLDGPIDEAVFTFRNLDDYRELRKRSNDNQHIIIVGGGYIGSELADSLTQNSTKVTMVFPEEKLGEKIFPKEFLEEYNRLFSDRGVKLVGGKKAKTYYRKDRQLHLILTDGTEISGDSIVLGIGAKPRIELAKKAGLEISKEGPVVDQHLQTSDKNIWSAGDIANYPDVILGRNRLEHVDHARHSGRLAGENMAGINHPYTHTPYFYSMIHTLKWQAVGKLSSSFKTLIETRENGNIVFYFNNNILKGILIWNLDIDLDDVRQLLKNPHVEEKNLIGVLKEK